MSKPDKKLVRRIERIERDIWKLRERADDFAGTVAGYELRGELDFIRASVAELRQEPKTAKEKARDKLARSLSGRELSKRQWVPLTHEKSAVAEEFVTEAYKRADALLAIREADKEDK